MKVPFGGIILVIFLCSEMTSGQDLEMVSSLVGYAFEAIQECAKENNVGLIRIATSLALSRSGADRNCKCAVACMMENFTLISNNRVETGLLVGVIDVIPIDALKVPVAELVTMCGKKGQGPDKCENANAFVMCLKQNAFSTAAKAVMQG